MVLGEITEIDKKVFKVWAVFKVYYYKQTLHILV